MRVAAAQWDELAPEWDPGTKGIVGPIPARHSRCRRAHLESSSSLRCSEFEIQYLHIGNSAERHSLTLRRSGLNGASVHRWQLASMSPTNPVSDGLGRPAGSE
jgi:hypothetical protein